MKVFEFVMGVRGIVLNEKFFASLRRCLCKLYVEEATYFAPIATFCLLYVFFCFELSRLHYSCFRELFI